MLLLQENNECIFVKIWSSFEKELDFEIHIEDGGDGGDGLLIKSPYK